MRVLLNIMVRYVSPTSHSTVLLMPTQKFLRILLDMPDPFEPSGPFTIRAAQFIPILFKMAWPNSRQSRKHWQCMSHFMYSKLLAFAMESHPTVQMQLQRLFHACVVCTSPVRYIHPHVHVSRSQAPTSSGEPGVCTPFYAGA